MDPKSSLSERLRLYVKTLLAVGALAAPASFAQTPPTAGLVAHYALNETAGLTAADSSGNNHPGTLAGYSADDQWISGKNGNALTFSNNQYVAVAALPDTTSTTWAAWVRVAANQNNGAVISAKFPGNTAGHSLGFGASGDGLKPRIVWNHKAGYTTNILLSPVAITLNNWHHIALTYDATSLTLRLYVDGEERGVAPGSQMTPFNSINLGRREASANTPFVGAADDVLIYNRALSLLEIKGLAGQNIAGPPVIKTAPVSRTVFHGSRVEFSVAVEGLPPFTYQWSKGATTIPGATNSTFVIPEATAADVGSYSVRISNSVNFTTSEPVTLAVNPIDLTIGKTVQWKFDETTGLTATDSGANALVGDLGNFLDEASHWIPGETGNGIMFNGANYIEVPDHPSIGTDLANGFTVATWFKSNVDLPATGGNRVVRMLERENSYFFLMNVGTGGMNFLVKRNTANFTANLNDSIVAGRWYHLAGTFDGQVARIYLDGVLKGEITVGGPMDVPTGNNPLRIGSDYNGAGGATAYFNGAMDDLTIWTRPLNSQELLNVMGRNLPNPPTFKVQPVGQTRFAGATATFFVDARGQEPFRYLWYKGEEEIRGATGPSLVLSNLTTLDAGQYKVKVSNALGEKFSDTVTLTVNPVADLTTGLAAHWKFDETSGLVAEDSSTGNHPTDLIDFADGTTHWVAGQAGGAIQFDGVINRGSVSNSANVEIDREGTFAFWIKPATYGTPISAGTFNHSQGRILRKPGHFDIYTIDDPGSVRRTIIANGASAPQTILETNVWQHFTVVFKGGLVQFYKNGFPVGDAKPGSIGPVGDLEIAMGYDDLVAPPRYYNGAMDDVRIWNRPLGEAEILQIAGKSIAGLPVIDIPPVAARRVEGNTATFSVFVTGQRPVAYQWYHNNVEIADGTNGVLTIPDLQLTDAGNYKVKVTNALGDVTSSDVELIVEPLDSISSGLIGYWNFDETEGAKLMDQSGRGNNGDLQNFTAIPGTLGIVGNAFDLDGVDDFIIVPHSATLDLTDQATISVWIQPRSFGVVGGLSRIVRKNVNYDLTTTTEKGGTLRFYGLNKVAYDAPDTGITLNTWQHIAIVIKDGFIQYYKDGRPLGASLRGFLGEINADPLIIGNFQADLDINRIFSGRMDELGIWSRALTPGDIDAIYQNGQLGKPLTAEFEPLNVKAISAGAQAEITFFTPYVGRTYAVQVRDSVSSGGWGPQTGVQFTSAGPSLMKATFAVPVAPKFFRIVAEAVPPVFSENFETGAVGWTHGGVEDNWELGTPTQGPGAAHGGANVYATGLSSNYREFTDSWLHSPIIDLRTTTRGTLTFWEWRNTDIDPLFHGAVVNVLDADTQIVLEELARDAGPTGGWQQRSFRLGANSLGKRIILEFRLYSDHTNLREGWFLDDLAIVPE